MRLLSETRGKGLLVHREYLRPHVVPSISNQRETPPSRGQFLNSEEQSPPGSKRAWDQKPEKDVLSPQEHSPA